MNPAISSTAQVQPAQRMSRIGDLIGSQFQPRPANPISQQCFEDHFKKYPSSEQAKGKGFRSFRCAAPEAPERGFYFVRLGTGTGSVYFQVLAYL